MFSCSFSGFLILLLLYRVSDLTFVFFKHCLPRFIYFISDSYYWITFITFIAFFLFFLADLLCDFEQDLCGWSASTNEVDVTPDLYIWTQYTSLGLQEESIPGPDGDYQDLKDKGFIMASDHVGGKAGARTELKSPVFKGNEHPLECFSFWFYFGVSCNSKCPLIRL